jgi:hypothetical protein
MPVVDEQETTERHQLLCLDVLRPLLDKLYNLLDIKLCKFLIEESDKNMKSLRLYFNLNLTDFIYVCCFLLISKQSEVIVIKIHPLFCPHKICIKLLAWKFYQGNNLSLLIYH